LWTPQSTTFGVFNLLVRFLNQHFQLFYFAALMFDGLKVFLAEFQSGSGE
jgi:hypothetical protein